MRRVPTLPLVIATLALLLVAGGAAAATPAVAAPAAASTVDGSDALGSLGDSPASVTAAECEVGGDTELVGCWNGTHYTEEPGFNQSDGLTDDELVRLTELSMARVEHIRERPFREAVPVETVTREEFANDTTGRTENDTEFQRWNDQVWKALFVVGEDETSADAIDAVFGGAVTGFYSPADERIVLVVAEGERLQVSELTLAHELGHAMQDQYEDLSDARFRGVTQDGDLAVDGIVEGEVVYIEEVYDARCADDWVCLDEPDGTSGGGDTPDAFNFGILQTVLQPYSGGALYVTELVEEDGWEAVDAAMEEPPTSTSEVIHREPDYETGEIDFDDAATGGWELSPDQGVDGAETAGEASMFVMFWYQSFEYDHAVLDPSGTVADNVRIHTQPEEELRTRANYNYAHETTDGWAGDELYPYRDGNGDEDTDGDRDGYVWVTEWQTPEDAAQFHEAYLRMLTAHGDVPYEPGEVYAVDDGDFRGAYGIERGDTTVTIAHAPEPEGVLELRPGSDLSVPASDDDTADTTDDDTADTTDESDDEGVSTDVSGEESDDATDGDDATGDGSTSGAAPGFGPLAALVALLLGAALLARRSRP
ncbi:Hvo_1808 family surface protein [Halorubrum sp. DTA46]|uniref:Hvo_1808 family surface protein n=1 Tax=Halorubrum sp. DTA46 TaxID=3402162 RepID=UPI003AACE164